MFNPLINRLQTFLDECRPSADLRLRFFLIALAVCAAYYFSALFSFALRVPSTRSSIIWAPNAVLLAALLTTPPRTWWIWLVAALPAHLLAQARDAAPILLLLCPFFANVAQAVLSAVAMRRFTDPPHLLDRLRNMVVFILVAVLAVPAVVSFAAAFLFVMAGWEMDYWVVAFARLLNNIVTGLAVAPLCLAIAGGELAKLRRLEMRRYAEFATVLLCLAGSLSIVSAWQPTETIRFPIRLYAPLPFLIWAGVRFGPAGLSITLLMFACDSLADSISGHGLFTTGSPAGNVLALEASLGALSLPLMLLASLTQEWRRNEETLRESEARYRALATATSEMIWRADAHGEGCFLTSAWRELTGQSEEESRNSGWLNAVHPDDRKRCRRLWNDALANRHVYENELRVRGLDGNYRHFYIHAVPILLADGSVHEWVGAAKEITDRKRAEQTLLESEARFRNMAEHAPVMIWISDLTAGRTYVNQQWGDFTGVTGEQALGFQWLDSVHPEDRERVRAAFFAAHERQEAVRVEYRLRRHDGEYRWVINSATPRFSESGEFLGEIGSIIDIAERKQAEDALRESEERLALALEAGRMGVWDWDKRTNRLEWSSEHFNIIGLAPFSVEPTYQTWTEHVHPDDLPMAMADMDRAIAERRHYQSEYRVVLGDGSHRWVSARGEPIYNQAGECVRVMGVIVDTTERKRAELRLSIQYRVTRVLADSATLADGAAALVQTMCECFDWQAGEAWQVSPESDSLTFLDGYSSRQDLVGFGPGVRPFAFEIGLGLSMRILQSRDIVWTTDLAGSDSERATLARKAGLKFALGIPINCSGRPLAILTFFSQSSREPDAELLQILDSIAGQIGQIVERKQAQDALRASEGRNRAILESALDSIITVDHQGAVIEFNAAAEKTFGYNRSDAIGKKIGDLIVAPSLRDAHHRGLAKYLITGNGAVLDKRLEMTAMRAAGSEFPVELAITRIGLDGPAPRCRRS